LLLRTPPVPQPAPHHDSLVELIKVTTDWLIILNIPREKLMLKSQGSSAQLKQTLISIMVNVNDFAQH